MVILELINNNIKVIDDTVTSSDSIIKVINNMEQVDTVTIGLLTLANGTKKIIEFVKKDKDKNEYIGRLIISEDDLNYLSHSSFFIETINSEYKQNSNTVTFKYNLPSIKLDIKKTLSNEYKELKEKILMLESKINVLSNRKIPNIKVASVENISPGMVPTAIDDKGTFVPMFPFSNHVVEVNGQRAANGSIKLDSSMIEYEKGNKSIEQVLSEQSEALVALMTLTDEVIKAQKELRTHLNEIDMKIEIHINNGII